VHAFEFCPSSPLICPPRLGAGAIWSCRPWLDDRDAALDAWQRLNNHLETKMARKPATRVEFTLFDVVYEDGSLRSNRRVPSDVLGSLDGDAAARAVIEEQDRIIAEKSGTPAVGVKSIHRSGSKNIDRTIRPSRRESASD
jgi:hypothetical protein